MDKYDKLLKQHDKKLLKIISIFLLISVFGYMYFYVNFNIFYFIFNITNIFQLVWDLTFGVVIGVVNDPSLRQYFIEIQKPMLETIQMSLLGTIFGAFFGLIAAFLSSEIFFPKFIYLPFRVLGSILRAIPTMMYAAILVVLFGSGVVAGIIAVTLFSFTIISKMTFENMAEIDRAPVEALTASGAKNSLVMRFAVLPQIMALFVASVLFTFEINIRASLILGYVGAGGIGENLLASFQNGNYHRVGLILIYTFIIVVIVDYISNKIRRKII